MPKRSKPEKTEAFSGATAQVRFDVKADTPSYYVNYIGVSHTAYDFTLSATKIPSPLPQEHAESLQTSNQLVIEPILQLVLPPLLIDGLIAALIDQKARYERTLAQQVKNNDEQHHKSRNPIN